MQVAAFHHILDGHVLLEQDAGTNQIASMIAILQKRGDLDTILVVIAIIRIDDDHGFTLHVTNRFQRALKPIERLSDRLYDWHKLHSRQ